MNEQGWTDEGHGIIRDEVGAVIAVTATEHYDKGRLIAAAPRMLDLLKDLVFSVDANGEPFGRPEGKSLWLIVREARAILRDMGRPA